MAISVLKQALEIEELVGSRQGQALLRAEAIVPGAGRDAIETLMSEADLVIGQVDVQEGRVVLEGTALCQAVYRQGDEASLRSLTAQAQLNHAFELPGAASGMPCRVAGEVEHVEAKYENGHMVFLVSVGLKLQVWKLTPAEIVTGIEGAPALETESETVRSVRLAAEAGVDTLLSETVSLPAALEARDALMRWGTVSVEGVEADLGGVRVRGKLNVEALVGSGVAGRPVALIKVPLSFERLVEMPDWLVENVYATAHLDRLDVRVEAGEEDDEADADMRIEAEVHISVNAVTASEAAALTDAYATRGPSIEIATQVLAPCVAIERVQASEAFHGTLLLPEDAPGAGTVLAVRVRPVIGGWGVESGRTTIDGVLEAAVLYMPGGSDRIAAAQSELPFSLSVQGELDDSSWVTVEALSAEANALMSDRLELRCLLNIAAETRVTREYRLLSGAEEGEDVKKRPGIVLFWPGRGDDIWSIGKRYNVSVEDVRAMNGGTDVIREGKALVLKI
ncbi:MAG TPA: DUF3794 domain-containing protein [Candidatus Pullichristensenella stercoripullorum]|nr:DUF3794 domain-containing protein [Candidatus Pullichristensenella stercoripullorum]